MKHNKELYIGKRIQITWLGDYAYSCGKLVLHRLYWQIGRLAIEWAY